MRILEYHPPAPTMQLACACGNIFTHPSKKKTIMCPGCLKEQNLGVIFRSWENRQKTGRKVRKLEGREHIGEGKE